MVNCGLIPMKTCFLSMLLCASSAWAQSSSPPPSAPPAASAQATPPKPGAEAIKPDTVVAVVNGKSYTAEEMDRILAPLSPVQKQIAQREPQAFLEQFAIFDLIAAMAEKAKLDQKSPYKEQIAETRRQILVTAQVNEYKNSLPIMPADQKKYYEANLDKYKEAKVKIILIPFAPTGATAETAGKKTMTEPEAKAKAESVAKLARSGVDFVKLVKEHSEDPGTSGRDGDLGIAVRSTTTNVPENVRTAILALKQGDVSDPVRQQNGYVIARAESIAVASYDSVKDDIFKEMKDAEVRKFADETKKKASAKIENGAYFNQPLATK
jgi:peptidyl-prolyl cis-trans isomerase C